MSLSLPKTENDNLQLISMARVKMAPSWTWGGECSPESSGQKTGGLKSFITFAQ